MADGDPDATSSPAPAPAEPVTPAPIAPIYDGTWPPPSWGLSLAQPPPPPPAPPDATAIAADPTSAPPPAVPPGTPDVSLYAPANIPVPSLATPPPSIPPNQVTLRTTELTPPPAYTPPGENDRRLEVPLPGAGAEKPAEPVVGNLVAGHMETPAERWAHDPLNPDAIKEMGGPAAEQAYAAMSPEERLSYDNNRAATKQLMFSAKQAELARQNAEQARQQYENNQAAMAAARAKTQAVWDDAMKQSQEKIDPQGFMHSRSFLQTLAAAGSVIVGGLAQGAGAKSNVGLDMIMKATEQHIEAQRDNMANQRALLGVRASTAQQQGQQAMEQYHAETAYRLASYQMAIDGLQTELQNYDPAGTTAQRGGQAILQLRAQQTAALLAYEKDQRDFNLKALSEQRQQGIADEAVRHNKADEAHANWATSIEAKKAASDLVVHPPEYYAQNYGAENAPKTAMTEKQFHQYQETLGKISERGDKATERERKSAEYNVFGAPKATLDKDGKIVLTPTPIQDPKTGKAWEPPTPKAAEELRAKREGTESVIASIDHLKAIRAKMGWASDISKNPEWQQAQSEFHNIVLQSLKAEGLNRFTEEDAKYLKGVLGNLEDPTRFIGITPGLDNARAIFTRQYAHALENAGAPQTDVTFPDTSQNHPPAPDDVDLAVKQALDTEINDKYPIKVREAAVSQIAEWAKSNDPKLREKAFEGLNELASNGNTKLVKEQAQAELQKFALPDLGHPTGLEP